MKIFVGIANKTKYCYIVYCTNVTNSNNRKVHILFIIINSLEVGQPDFLFILIRTTH